MKKFKVKFFGSKERKGQIQLVKGMIVEAPDRYRVEDTLRMNGYRVINGLKINEYH